MVRIHPINKSEADESTQKFLGDLERKIGMGLLDGANPALITYLSNFRCRFALKYKLATVFGVCILDALHCKPTTMRTYSFVAITVRIFSKIQWLKPFLFAYGSNTTNTTV